MHAIRAELPAPPAGPGLDFIVGDLDSLRPETRTWFLEQRQGRYQDQDQDQEAGADEGGDAARRIVLIDDQDSTDFTKAVQFARELSRPRRKQQRRGAVDAAGQGEDAASSEDDIICYSGLGGRVDQAMSQLHHLYMFQRGRQRQQKKEEGGREEETQEQQGTGSSGEEDDRYPDGRMYLTNGESLTFVLRSGRHRIRIRDHLRPHDNSPSPPRVKNTALGKNVGLIPLAGPSELTTRGLEWDVRDWRTEFGGRISTSNHTTPEHDVIDVHTTNDILFTIDFAPATAPGS